MKSYTKYTIKIKVKSKILSIQRLNNKINEKALSETQTLRAGRSKAEPKIFAPPQTPFPGAQDGQNLISRRWSPSLPINLVW